MKKPQLLDRFGRPVQRKVLKEEVSAAQTTGVRSPVSGYPADGLDPRRLSNILRAADQGDPMQFFELAELIEERDLHYAGVLGTRKRSVAQIDITVEAASEDKQDVEIADMVRDWLKRDELADELFDILDAVGKGISFTEIIWDTSSGQWQPQRLESRSQRWYTFDREDGQTPLLGTENGDQPLQPYKFITATIKAKSGLPIRSGIARLAAWNYLFKMYSQRDWAIFTQTFGQPIRVGKYGPGASEKEKETLYQAVANIAGDCAAIMPESMLIEFVENNSTGSSLNLYKERCDWLDQQASKAILGQTATTDAIAGGHAIGREHRQVQEDIERADAKALAGILNRDLIRPWVALEYGANVKAPRLVIARPEEEDVKLKVDSIERLVPLGMRVAASHMNEMVGIPEPTEGEVLLTAPATSQPTPDDETNIEAQAQKRTPDVIDRLEEDAVNITDAAGSAMIDTVRELMNDCTSLEQFRDRLGELDSSINTDEFASKMRMALVWADLTGEDA